MGRGALQRREHPLSRSFTVTLPADLFEQVVAHMEEFQLTNLAEAVRDLLRQHLSATPLDGTIRAARAEYIRKLREFCLMKVMVMCKEIESTDNPLFTGS